MSAFDIYSANTLSDVEQLRPTLESAIQNPITKEIIGEEVEEVLTLIDLTRQNQSKRYYGLAITTGGQVLGVMGLQQPGTTMSQYATTESPAELVNAYVLRSERAAGVGRALVQHLEAVAVERGKTEILVNSGPRYMLSGWPFWRRMYGEPAAVAKDYYGPRFDAMIWRKSLPDKK